MWRESVSVDLDLRYSFGSPGAEFRHETWQADVLNRSVFQIKRQHSPYDIHPVLIYQWTERFQVPYLRRAATLIAPESTDLAAPVIVV